MGARLVVTIPPPADGQPPSAPTGLVFNGSDDFAVHANRKCGPSRFIFATEDGTIAGWSPDVDVTHAVLAVDNSASDAIYKWLALGSNVAGNFLYAAGSATGTRCTYVT
jgi:uncharacterized protein (TIGR03118 family)